MDKYSRSTWHGGEVDFDLHTKFRLSETPSPVMVHLLDLDNDIFSLLFAL